MIKQVLIASAFCIGTAACTHGFGPFQTSAAKRCDGLTGSSLEQCRRDAGYSDSRVSSSYRSGEVANAPTTDDPSVLRGTGGSEQQGAR